MYMLFRIPQQKTFDVYWTLILSSISKIPNSAQMTFSILFAQGFNQSKELNQILHYYIIFIFVEFVLNVCKY